MENSSIPLLAICIPTHNGGDRLVNNVKKILTCKDNRFIIHVNNNASKDDTEKRLNEIAERDNRLIISSNETCVPAYVNFEIVLSKAIASYVYIIIDKESLNPTYLPDYLDMLEFKKPFFGRVIYYGDSLDSVIIHKKGVDAIKNVSHFGSTHTTGFFYRKDLYQKEIVHLVDITDGGNWWITDLVSLCLGFEYDGISYNSPLNLFDYQAVLGGVSKSKFSKENLYFYGKQRCVDYDLFINLILEKDNSKEVIPIINALNVRYVHFVTFAQREYFKDKQRCLHYGVETRNVSYKEMLHWCMELKRIMDRSCKSHGVKSPDASFWLVLISNPIKEFIRKHPKFFQPIIRRHK